MDANLPSVACLGEAVPVGSDAYEVEVPARRGLFGGLKRKMRKMFQRKKPSKSSVLNALRPELPKPVTREAVPLPSVKCQAEMRFADVWLAKQDELLPPRGASFRVPQIHRWK